MVNKMVCKEKKVVLFAEKFERHCFFKKMGQTRPLFVYLYIFSLFKQTIEFFQQFNVNNVTAIQYTETGFEPTTFGT